MTKRPSWKLAHANVDLGYIPMWLDEDDPDPAWKQIDKNYKHGGGWHSSRTNSRAKMLGHVFYYPGDPPQHPLATARMRDEIIVFYPHAFVAIFQKDGSWDMARID